MQQTIKFGKVKLTVVSATVGDGLVAERLKNMVLECEPANAEGYYHQFGRLATQTKEFTGLPFDIRVIPDDGKDKVYAAYNALIALPEKLFLRWIDAINEVNASEDMDFLPNDDPTS